MSGRRGNHEGSIYHRSSDRRWMGVVLLGYNPSGRPIRKYVSSKTRAEVIQKLKQLRQQIDEGQLIPNSTLKIGELFARWSEDILRHQFAPSAADNYMSVASLHVLPTLGHKKLSELTVADVDRLLSTKTDLGYSTSTVRCMRKCRSRQLASARTSSLRSEFDAQSSTRSCIDSHDR
jgi:hypothetical protein